MLRPKEKRDYDYRQYAASVVIDPGCAGRNGKSDSAVTENASIDEDDPLPPVAKTVITLHKVDVRLRTDSQITDITREQCVY